MKKRLIAMMIPVIFVFGVTALFFILGNIVHIALAIFAGIVSLIVSLIIICTTGEYFKWVITGEQPEYKCKSWFGTLTEIHRKKKL